MADALAEFVDNAIQACCGVKPTREIKIGLYFAAGASNYAAIFDNGCGMDVQKLQEFATYSLDQDTRNNNIRPLGSEESISMFGVGAKQAGFYLGSRIKVITKSENNQVMVFELDALAFKQRSENHENVYEGKVKLVSSFDPFRLFNDTERQSTALVKAVESHMLENNNHFSVFILQLDNVLPKLSSRAEYTLLGNDIAEIYHFHLNRGDRYDQLEREKRSRESSSRAGSKR